MSDYRIPGRVIPPRPTGFDWIQKGTLVRVSKTDTDWSNMVGVAKKAPENENDLVYVLFSETKGWIFWPDELAPID